MTNQLDPDRKIEGSYIFTGPMSQKGYALNKLGASLMSDEARAAFKNDEECYIAQFGLRYKVWNILIKIFPCRLI